MKRTCRWHAHQRRLSPLQCHSIHLFLAFSSLPTDFHIRCFYRCLADLPPEFQGHSGHELLTLAIADARVESPPILDLLDLDAALVALAADHPDRAQVVELRFFGGLTAAECAAVLDVTERTVERRWRFARAWLYRRLSSEPPA